VKVRGGKAEATLAQADGQLQSLVMEPWKDFQDGGNAGFEPATCRRGDRFYRREIGKDSQTCNF
jgi:hypothetical protein